MSGPPTDGDVAEDAVEEDGGVAVSPPGQTRKAMSLEKATYPAAEKRGGGVKAGSVPSVLERREAGVGWDMKADPLISMISPISSFHTAPFFLELLPFTLPSPPLLASPLSLLLFCVFTARHSVLKARAARHSRTSASDRTDAKVVVEGEGDEDDDDDDGKAEEEVGEEIE